MRELVAELTSTGDTPLQSITELRRWATDRFGTELRAKNDEARAAGSDDVRSAWRLRRRAPASH